MHSVTALCEVLLSVHVNVLQDLKWVGYVRLSAATVRDSPR